MSQLYSNAVDTTLAATLSDVATTATLTDGAGLNTPTGGDYELLVLEAFGNIEIVRMTARTGNEITITRAQESTAAQSWPSGARVFSGITAGTLSGLLRNNATGNLSVAAGDSAAAAGEWSVAVGVSASAAGAIAVALGRAANAAGQASVAVGQSCDSLATGTISLGNAAYAEFEDSISIGTFSYAGITTGNNAIAIGSYAGADVADALAVGAGSLAEGAGSIALGHDSRISADNCLMAAALPVVNRYPSAQASAAWMNTSSGAVITSGALNLKTAQVYEIPIPAGVTFFPDEVGIIISLASAVTVQPTVQFGISGSVQEYIDAVATTGLSAQRDRQRFQTLKTAKGATTLRFEVTVGATATTLTGRVYWHGFAVEDA